MVGTMLTGCGKSGTDAQAGAGGSEQKATVDIFQNKSEISTQLQDAASTYMAAHPNVKINVESVQGNDYNTALKAKMLNKDSAEIFTVGVNDLINNYSEYLEDLSDQPWVKNVNDGLLNDVTISNKVFGMPVSIEGYGLVYNKDIFKAAGIDPSTLTTYDAIDKAFASLQSKIEAGELKDKFPELKAVEEYAAKESWIPGLHMLNVPLANEFASSAELLKSDSIQLKYANELKALLDLETKYTPSKDNLALLNAVDYSMEIGGGLGIERVAVVQQGNWIGPELKGISEKISSKMDIIPIPLKGVKEDSIAVGVPTYWCVNTKSSDVDKAAAKDFLNWLYQSEEGKEIVVNKFGFIPPFKNYDGLKISDPLSAAVKRYVDAGKTMTWVTGGWPSGYEGQAGSDIQGYLNGQKTWEECVQSLKDDFKKLKK